MRIIALADIHGRTAIPTDVINNISAADLVVIAGDITNFGGYENAHKIITYLKTYNDSIVAIPGNCDRIGVNKYLDDAGISIHGQSTLITAVMLHGVGGCSTTPFHTPQEYPEKEISLMLNKWKLNTEAQWRVLVTHCPPRHTSLDRTFMGMHVGSVAIRTFIETHNPDLVICGHIHEARGQDRLHDTICINCGTFPKHYAIITLGESIEYELH